MAQRSFVPGRRSRNIFVGLSILYAIVGLRLAWIQVFNRREFVEIAERRVRTIPIPAQRGVIKDRRGELLAINADAGSVSIDPSFYWDPAKWPISTTSSKKDERVPPDKDAVAKTIADALTMDVQAVRLKLDKKGKFAPLKRHVPLESVRRVESADIPGLMIAYEPRRVYPMGSLAAHILGFTNSEGLGQYGMELACNKYLLRKDGSQVQEVDRKGRIIPGTLRSEREPEDGASVTLTIDSRIQQVAERELGNACTKYKAAGGTCIVLDPNTGDILAMANYPRFDPNKPKPASLKDSSKAMRDRLDYLWKAHAATDLYESGSTMKGVTAAAAMDAGAVSLTDRFNCPETLRIGAHTVHDITHGKGSFGVLNLGGILANSSNVGMSQVGLRLGAQKLNDYVRAFGLLDKSGIEIPGEGRSWMPPLKQWDRHFTATVAFGQSISFTPLRLALAYGAIANGGNLMKPRIVKSVDWPESATSPARREEFQPATVRRVITRSTARSITELLGGVVTAGTGKPGKIRGYTLVGKTGSAQKVVNGRYESGKFIASFIGFLPQNKPRAVILVTVDEPKGTHWGATTAAPVFREVARQTMWYLQIPPDDPKDRFDGSDPATWPRKSAARRAARRR